MNILQKTGVVLSLLLAAACSKDDSEGFIPPPTPPDMDETLLNDLQRTHFNFFWKLTNTANGLVPDRASATNNEAMSSIAATGFGLTAYIVGVERGFVTRDEAAQRTVVTLRTFNDAPKGTDPVFSAGYKGFFYHFLNRNTSLREVEVHQAAQITGFLFIHHLCIFAELFVTAIPCRLLQHMDRLWIVTVFLALAAHLMSAHGGQRQVCCQSQRIKRLGMLRIRLRCDIL